MLDFCCCFSIEIRSHYVGLGDLDLDMLDKAGLEL